jgi:hypothetical protein
MPKTVTITVPDEAAERFERLTTEGACSAPELFQDMLRVYQRQLWKYRLRKIQRYGARKARELGIKDEEDVYRLVQEFRNEERSRAKRESPEQRGN